MIYQTNEDLSPKVKHNLSFEVLYKHVHFVIFPESGYGECIPPIQEAIARHLPNLLKYRFPMPPS